MPRGETSRFLGHSPDAKGYQIWFPESRSVKVRRNVTFHDVPDEPKDVVPADELSAMWDEVLSEDSPTLEVPYNTTK